MASSINADNGVSSGSAGLKSSADSSGVLQLQTNGTTAVTIDASQNAGLGVTPSAWNSAAKALQYSTSGSLWAVGGQSRIGNNHYYDAAGTFRYLLSGAIASDFSQTSGGFSWSIAPSGTAGNAVTFTTSMVLDSSGRLGVGTTTPVGKLTVVGGNSNNLIVDNDGSQYTQLLLARNGTANTGGDLLIDGTNATMSLRMLAVGALRFCTSTSIGDGTERARIDSSGNLLVGNTAKPTTNFYGLYVKSSTSTSSDWAFWVDNSSLATGLRIRNDGYLNAAPTYSLTGGTANLSIDSSGYITRATSSIRYKRDVETYDKGLSTVLAVRPVYYKSSVADANGDVPETQFAGLIAEELDALGLNEFVEYNQEGQPDAVRYGNMVSLCIKAIQEQQALITQLQADVAALKGASA